MLSLCGFTSGLFIVVEVLKVMFDFELIFSVLRLGLSIVGILREELNAGSSSSFAFIFTCVKIVRSLSLSGLYR